MWKFFWLLRFTLSQDYVITAFKNRNKKYVKKIFIASKNNFKLGPK